MIKRALELAYRFLLPLGGAKESGFILKSLARLSGLSEAVCPLPEFEPLLSYESVQTALSDMSKRDDVKKEKGIYYTPADLVGFILGGCVSLCGEERLCFDKSKCDTASFVAKTVYDPACGAGEFLLAALEMKFSLFSESAAEVTAADVRKIAGTVFGNDIDPAAVAVSKLRLFICAVNRFGIEKCRGLAAVLDRCFTVCDFVCAPPAGKRRFDIILGNPPYVEDRKSGLSPKKRYGNIYANVLLNAAARLKKGGAFGFVIPLSYVSTPRMGTLREELFAAVPEQYILSYSDRPDCLFSSVHQKLCVLIGRAGTERRVFTSNYRYWYKEERAALFAAPQLVRNDHALSGCIPKLGTAEDVSVFEKVTNADGRTSLLSLTSEKGEQLVFLNMRAAFWIKAFRKPHSGAEYKALCFETEGQADLAFCLLNSSLFWWYWIAVSDCWHITKKELLTFMVPQGADLERAHTLASRLEDRLEETKKYVGTKQTDYEYKHRDCAAEIHEIDDFVNALFGLTDEESGYIKDFAFRYRISGGAENAGN